MNVREPDSVRTLDIRRAVSVTETIDVGTGRAVVHSARSPAKATDNEDAACLLCLGPGRALLVVADGAGGHAAGAEASALALEALQAALAAADPDAPSMRPAVLDGIEAANAAVQALGVGAATTLAVVAIRDGVMRPYHVGDSQIMLVGQRGHVRLATVAHSPTGYGVEAGLIAESDALQHEERHLVSNIVGAADMRIEVGAAVLARPRDTLLLGTDGLFDNLQPEEIVAAIRCGPLERAARTLAEAAEVRMRREDGGEPSKPDDLTFVLYRATAPKRPGGAR